MKKEQRGKAMKYCVRNYFGLISCLLFALLSSQVWAISETFHFYRMTGAGTWEQLNDLGYISTDGNEGSIDLEKDSTGPATDELTGLLSGFVTECIKDTVLYEESRHAPPHCPVVANSFFLKLPPVGKKLKPGRDYSSRHYRVAAGPGNASRETHVNQRIVDHIPVGKWGEMALLHKLLYTVLRHNAAASGGGMLEDVNDELESDIKEKQGVGAAAKFAKNEHDRTDDLQESWLKNLTMVRSFFTANQPYLDLVFGTNCQWRISVIYSAGVFRGLLFESAGMTFLLLMSSSLETRKGIRKRSSAFSIKKREHHDSGGSRGSIGSRSNSGSSLRSGGSSFTELPQPGSYTFGSPKQSSDEDSHSGVEWWFLAFQLPMQPTHSALLGVPFWFYIPKIVGPLGSLNPLP